MSVIENPGNPAPYRGGEFDSVAMDSDKAKLSMSANPKTLQQKVYRLLVGLVAVVFLCIVLLGVLIWSLSTRTSVEEPTEGLVRAAAALRSNMDLEADPCTDFAQYACGGWMKKHVIPEDTDSWSNFVILRDNTAKTIFNLMNAFLDNQSAKDPPYLSKLLNFYTSCMNTTAMDTAEEDGISEVVSSVLQASDKTQALQIAGASNAEVFYILYVDASTNDPKTNAFWLVQGALGMSLKNDYDEDEKNADKQTSYKKLLSQLWSNYNKNYTEAEVEEIVTNVYTFEECVAEGMNTPAEEREASTDYKSNPYKDVTDPSFKPELLIETAIKSRLSNDVEPADDVEFYLLNDYVTATHQCVVDHLGSEDSFKKYVATRLMTKYMSVGKEAWRDIAWEYQQELTKIEIKPPVWKTCLSSTTNYMPEAIGRIFAAEAFKETAKENTLEMIDDIKTAFKSILPDLEWMDDETRDKAVEKADAVKSKIGYADWLLEEEKLNEYMESMEMKADNRLNNIMNVESVLSTRMFDMAGKPVDKTKWYMSPATVNAYYSALGNEMVFPAAILQPPFYHETFPSYVNYGAIGVVIGHELTHGFDDNGRKYDKDGYLKGWYTQKAESNFNERAKCLSDQYSGYEIMGNQVNGNLTLGENIADNGGVKQAYIAYQNWVKRNGEEPTLPGLDLTNEQAFFLSYAQIWCQKKTNEAYKFMTASDSHSPGIFRIKGPLVNSKQFAAAYNCNATSNMNPPAKCEVW